MGASPLECACDDLKVLGAEGLGCGNKSIEEAGFDGVGVIVD